VRNSGHAVTVLRKMPVTFYFLKNKKSKKIFNIKNQQQQKEGK